MKMIKETGPEDIADKLAACGIDGGQLPADYTLAKNEAQERMKAVTKELGLGGLG